MSLFTPKPKEKVPKPVKVKPEKKARGGLVGGKRPLPFNAAAVADSSSVADLALRLIQEGIMVVDRANSVRYMNPAAVEMSGIGKAGDAVGLDIESILKLEKIDGEKVEAKDNKFIIALKENKAFESREFVLVSIQGDKKTPVNLNVVPSGNPTMDRIVSFRNIAKELEEEGAQSEFISTASHEMRTPVASIEGYLGLALNPQTATIDARARQYIESAHSASKRLGNLFKDLLDVTKLDDKRARVHLVPVELNGFVKKFADEYSIRFREKNISYSFGADGSKKSKFGGGRTLTQVVYTLVDVDFLGEIISNLLENALKYTPNGGAIWANVQGDGDRALINVTDTGIGIAAEDLQHIFQKFYRADNSQTRTIGGTGLGLYLVKQRVEAMDGRVWAESAFGEGSTFYVSLPRITAEEYERRQVSLRNRAAVEAFEEQAMKKDSASEAANAKMNALQVEAQARAEIEAEKQRIREQEALKMRQQQTVVAPTATITQATQAPVMAPTAIVTQAAQAPGPVQVSMQAPATVVPAAGQVIQGQVQTAPMRAAPGQVQAQVVTPVQPQVQIQMRTPVTPAQGQGSGLVARQATQGQTIIQGQAPAQGLGQTINPVFPGQDSLMSGGV